MQLKENQIEKYSRQILLNDIGAPGQKKLLQAKVLVVGAGGLGSTALMYLASAGIGVLGVVDNDKVELSNIQRQIIFDSNDIGKNKVNIVKNKLKNINNDIKIIPFKCRLDEKNSQEILHAFDVIIDGSDNFKTKYLLNDTCFFLNKPLIYGGILGFYGQVFTFIPQKSACLRCFFKSPQDNIIPTCEQAGVLGPIAGNIGTIQAIEAMKIILGINDLLINRMLCFDAKKMIYKYISIEKNCHACSTTELLDLTTYRCPVTFVKSKMKLDTMQKGEVLKIIVKDNEAKENLPKQLLNKGFKILNQIQTKNLKEIFVQKS
jgi:adenylyltransferase/sulfurtransferase